MLQRRLTPGFAERSKRSRTNHRAKQDVAKRPEKKDEAKAICPFADGGTDNAKRSISLPLVKLAGTMTRKVLSKARLSRKPDFFFVRRHRTGFIRRRGRFAPIFTVVLYHFF